MKPRTATSPTLPSPALDPGHRAHLTRAGSSDCLRQMSAGGRGGWGADPDAGLLLRIDAAHTSFAIPALVDPGAPA